MIMANLTFISLYVLIFLTFKANKNVEEKSTNQVADHRELWKWWNKVA